MRIILILSLIFLFGCKNIENNSNFSLIKIESKTLHNNIIGYSLELNKEEIYFIKSISEYNDIKIGNTYKLYSDKHGWIYKIELIKEKQLIIPKANP